MNFTSINLISKDGPLGSKIGLTFSFHSNSYGSDFSSSSTARAQLLLSYPSARGIFSCNNPSPAIFPCGPCLRCLPEDIQWLFSSGAFLPVLHESSSTPIFCGGLNSLILPMLLPCKVRFWSFPCSQVPGFFHVSLNGFSERAFLHILTSDQSASTGFAKLC